MCVRIQAAYTTWWANFWDAMNEKHSKRSFSNDQELMPYNGRDVYGTEYIEFDTEADAAAFILKWG